MSLYELDERVEHVLHLLSIEEDDGTICFLESSLEALELDREQKLLNCAWVVRNALAQAQAIREEENRLSAKRGLYERRAERVTEYVAKCGGLEEGEKFEKAGNGWKWTSSERVEVDPDFDSPAYMRVKQIVDRVALKAALKRGWVVEGAKLLRTKLLKVL